MTTPEVLYSPTVELHLFVCVASLHGQCLYAIPWISKTEKMKVNVIIIIEEKV